MKPRDHNEETEERWGHPAIEHVGGPTRPGWLLLASDGAYEPHEDITTTWATTSPAIRARPPSSWSTMPSATPARSGTRTPTTPPP